MKAADFIAQITNNEMDAQAGAMLYRRWCADQFLDQARQLAARYAELEEPPVWLQNFEFLSNPLANSESSVITST
jgi:hypothetical protein